jgi:hypothetical protein
MANRFRDFVESIVYAGMKPGQRPSEGASGAKPGFFARFLSGPAPSDPLYLTNQSFGQKAKRYLLMSLPVLLVLAAGGLFSLRYFGARTEVGPKQLSAKELAAKTLPAFNKPIDLETNRDVEVTEVHFERGVMVGNIRNLTTHAIVEAVVTFELADASDSRLGGVTVTETNLAAGATRTFKKPIDQVNAVSALVREVETR